MRLPPRFALALALALALGCGSSGASDPETTDAAGETPGDGAIDSPPGDVLVDTASEVPAKTPPGKTRCGPGDTSGPPVTYCNAATEDCCGDTLKCVARGKCTDIAFQCSSTASCSAGMKCCVDPPTSGAPVAKCQTSCAQVTLCETKDECAAGEACTPDPVSSSCKK